MTEKAQRILVSCEREAWCQVKNSGRCNSTNISNKDCALCKFNVNNEVRTYGTEKAQRTLVSCERETHGVK